MGVTISAGYISLKIFFSELVTKLIKKTGIPQVLKELEIAATAILIQFHWIK
jgi:hypothetical protein